MWWKNRLDGVEWEQELGSRWVGRISSVLEFTWLLWGAPGLSSYDLMPQNIRQWYPVSSYAVGPLVLREVSFEHNLLDDRMGVSGVVIHTYCVQHSEMSGFIRNSLINCGAHGLCVSVFIWRLLWSWKVSTVRGQLLTLCSRCNLLTAPDTQEALATYFWIHEEINEFIPLLSPEKAEAKPLVL